MATRNMSQSPSSSQKEVEGAESVAKDTHSVSKRTEMKRCRLKRNLFLVSPEKRDHAITFFATICTIQLQKELMSLMMSGDKGISAFPDGDNLFRWIGTITGPIGTVYENLMYKLILEFPSGYPYKAPMVKFDTPCYHPNVDNSGNICLDILKDKWSALYDVRTILLSIQSLLGEPNNDSPLNVQAAELWLNQELYKKVLLEKYQRDTKQSADTV